MHLRRRPSWCRHPNLRCFVATTALLITAHCSARVAGRLDGGDEALLQRGTGPGSIMGQPAEGLSGRASDFFRARYDPSVPVFLASGNLPPPNGAGACFTHEHDGARARGPRVVQGREGCGGSPHAELSTTTPLPAGVGDLDAAAMGSLVKLVDDLALVPSPSDLAARRLDLGAAREGKPTPLEHGVGASEGAAAAADDNDDDDDDGTGAGSTAATSAGASNGGKRPTCAVVGNGHALKGRGLGAEIDSHDVVIRFNNGLVRGYEGDAGSRTSLRLVNHVAAQLLDPDAVVSAQLEADYRGTWAPLLMEPSHVAWLRAIADGRRVVSRFNAYGTVRHGSPMRPGPCRVSVDSEPWKPPASALGGPICSAHGGMRQAGWKQTGCNRASSH